MNVGVYDRCLIYVLALFKWLYVFNVFLTIELCYSGSCCGSFCSVMAQCKVHYATSEVQ